MAQICDPVVKGLTEGSSLPVRTTPPARETCVLSAQPHSSLSLGVLVWCLLVVS